MKVIIKDDEKDLGKAAGELATELIHEAILRNGSANIILATGSSQFETLSQLVQDKSIRWDKVTMFHLDEYIDLPVSHKASFRKYLQERFISKVPELKAINLINGETDPEEECQRLEKLIAESPIDVALVGIGENGHLAFNDPPADFETDRGYIVVTLDDKCKQQQVNEGWFDSIGDVPNQAISMSVRQIMRSKNILCIVPGTRKAKPVKDTLEKPVDNNYPATILRNHASCWLFLDKESASLLKDNEN